MFLNNANLLLPHVEYAANYTRAMKILDGIDAKKDADWVQFVRKAEMKKELKYRQLSDFLIMPIQRMPRYVMLLTALDKKTPVSRFAGGLS